MASITLRLSERVDARGKSELLVRFIARRDKTFRLKSRIFINPSKWDAREGRLIIRKLSTPEQRELIETRSKIEDLCTYLLEEYASADPERVTREYMQKAVERFWHPRLSGGPGFFEAFDVFIERAEVCKGRRDQFRVLSRSLQRFEAYRGASITFDDLDVDFLTDFVHFLTIEHTLTGLKKYREIYKGLPKKSMPKPRGVNTICGYMKKLRAFVRDSTDRGFITDNPFDDFQISGEVYGTPYFLTIDEREAVARCNLSRHPSLEAQRDIFIFHCLTGPRYGDLSRLRKCDVVGDVLEYIPHKTSESQKVGVVSVPLTDTAREIVAKYAKFPGDSLLPFISRDKYNDALKLILKASRVNRYVSVLDPVTQKEEKRRLSDVASSHLARRTFIGNIYRQVRDQNLVSSVTGHVEGSRAFARYRTIDMDMKRDIVGLLENQDSKK